MLHRPNFVLLIAFAMLAVTACSDGTKELRQQPAARKASVTAKLVAGDVSIESYGPDATLDEARKNVLVTLVGRYVDAALLHPLERGTVGDGYPGLFAEGLQTEATTTDASVLTLASVGKVDRFDEQATPITISGLADGNGALVFLGAKFTVTVDAPTPAGPGTFANDVELTYAPAGDGWQIAGYRVVATRRLPDATPTTTTAVSGS